MDTKRILLVGFVADAAAMVLLVATACLGLVAVGAAVLAKGLEPAPQTAADTPYPGNSAPQSASPQGDTGGDPPAFWIFAVSLVGYGVRETMFGNWGTTLLTGEGVSTASANYVFAAFWASVTLGRLLISLAPRPFR